MPTYWNVEHPPSGSFGEKNVEHGAGEQNCNRKNYNFYCYNLFCYNCQKIVEHVVFWLLVLYRAQL